MAAKAVVVFNNGQPLINVECLFCLNSGTERKWPLTNSDGYTILQDMPPASGYIKIVANGFKSYLQLVSLDGNNQTIRVANGPDAPNDILLPALSFNKPSRDRIINVMANLCNINDATGLTIFEPFINQLILTDKNRADDWIARLKDSGSTHITTDITGDYDEILPYLGTRYPIPGGDYTRNINDFRRILDYLLGMSLIPIVKSGCDGHSYQSGGMTYGWSWGMDNMPYIYNQLKDYHDQCLWSTGYDGCFPDWTPDELLAFLRMMRVSLGDNNIDTEFGSGPGESISYCHLGNGAADWTDDKLGDLDSFSLELQTFAQSEQEITGQIEGMTEVFQRIGPGGIYLHNTKTQIQMYETLAYWEIRKFADFQQAKQVAQRAFNVGYRTFGNGLP